MVYNTNITGMRAALGFDLTSSLQDSLIQTLQEMADEEILNYTSSPNSYGAKVVERQLCILIYNNAVQMHNYTANERKIPMAGFELTTEMKRKLTNSTNAYTQIVPFDGYNVYDNTVGGY